MSEPFDIVDTQAPSLFEESPEMRRKAIPRSLIEKFGLPPFSTLDKRQGYWQTRKDAWLGLGIESEIGRAGDLTYGDFRGGDISGGDVRTSVFDPVLCEMAYRWFAPPGGRVFDPFAGGSVRGVVAALLGHSYVGVELREEQVTANRQQAARIFGPGGLDLEAPIIEPRWVNGDAMDSASLVDGGADFIFTCPPYADLEVYSYDPRDLSFMSYGRFMAAYRYIIASAVERLREDRFAAIVVGDVRDKRGRYRGLVAHTIAAFEEVGASLYNEAIIIRPVGTGSARAEKQFTASRKMVRLHESLLVFVKGDPIKATARCATPIVDDALDRAA